jgi:hypothetical protein
MHKGNAFVHMVPLVFKDFINLSSGGNLWKDRSY